MNWHEKTEKVKAMFKARAKEQMKCGNCKTKTSKEKMLKSIDQTIKIAELNDGPHLIDEIENKRDLLFFECSECGRGATFKPVTD